MHRVRIETFKLVRREKDAPLMAFDLCKEVLLLIVMCWRNIAYRKEKINTRCDVWKPLAAVTNEDSDHLNLCYRNCETTFLSWDILPSMPMSRRLDVSCPQFLCACCLLIQFQLKPRKSRTIFLPTVSFRVCCRYTLTMHGKRDTVLYQESWKKSQLSKFS